jgi:hypothetical protein
MLSYNGNYSDAAKALAQRYNLKASPKQAKKPKPAPIKKDFENDFGAETDANLDGLEKKWRALIEIIKDWNLEIRYNLLTRVMDYRFDSGAWENEIDGLVSDIIYEMENRRGIASISADKIYSMIMSNKIKTSYNI